MFSYFWETFFFELFVVGNFIQVKFVIDSLRGLQLVDWNFIQVKFGIDSLRS